MDHSVFALIGPKDWTSAIGKETSDTSFKVNSLKKDDKVLTALVPSRYPEKLWSLLFSISLTDRVLLKVEKIDRDLGETIIALDLAGKRRGMLHVSDMVDLSAFKGLISGTALEGWKEMDPEPSRLRETLFDIDNDWPEAPPVVVVDQAFPVKGVGTVVLGFVVSGSVKKHQELFTCPGGKRTQIRSIQIQDADHTEAPAGSRVGLALKNIDPEDLPRGTALTIENGLGETSSLKLKVRVSPHWKESIEKGIKLHLWSSLQFVPAEISDVISEERGDKGRTIELVIDTETPVWTAPFSRFGLAYLDSRTFRLFASGETI